MQKISDYCLVLSTTLSGLEKRVKQGIKDGWQPIGGYRQIFKKSGMYYSQTMVKHEEQ